MKLINGVERHLASPETFEIPSDEEKAQIKAGMYVKLGFVIEDQGGPTAERMWVKVTGKNKGTLANDPVFVALKYEDEVEFRSENILSIMEPEVVH